MYEARQEKKESRVETQSPRCCAQRASWMDGRFSTQDMVISQLKAATSISGSNLGIKECKLLGHSQKHLTEKKTQDALTKNGLSTYPKAEDIKKKVSESSDLKQNGNFYNLMLAEDPDSKTGQFVGFTIDNEEIKVNHLGPFGTKMTAQL